MASPPQNPPPTAAQQQPPPTEQSQPPPPASKYPDPVLHNIALGLTPLAMLALFLPPRRMNVQQLLLGGAVLWGTNQLVGDWSGHSFGQRAKQRVGTFTDALTMSGEVLPEKAQRTQALLRQERERLRLQQQQLQQSGIGSEAESRSKGTGTGTGSAGKEERGILEAIWMGNQDDDWKAKRDQKEREALSEGGGGYWGLITDHLAEVWNNGVKKEQEAQVAEARAKADASEGKKP
ncbi:hypothetical protein SLS62_000745 [Diatrype stigma]|uniref:Rhomboid family membrane protein n=1 Tax=Diatrype stigma TaxID=117547 RepID=A0AAN9V0C7_9PEZI